MSFILKPLHDRVHCLFCFSNSFRVMANHGADDMDPGIIKLIFHVLVVVEYLRKIFRKIMKETTLFTIFKILGYKAQVAPRRLINR